jgi:putative spermidine/putrescine transport system ATP-binding protein
MVFQDYALFPHMTVAENIGFGLQERGVPRAQIARRVAELLTLIHLPDIGERHPAALSGGQRQRVALARAVAHPPRVLLMDEPLGALDVKLREAMQGEIRAIQQTLGITTIFVTHDQTEAMSLSDRIVVMHQGRVVQSGTPRGLYEHPGSRFVADFFGRVNFLPVTVRDVTRDGAEVNCSVGACGCKVPRSLQARRRWHCVRSICICARPTPTSHASTHCPVASSPASSSAISCIARWR